MMIEVQHIFQKYGTQYRASHKLPLHQLKAMHSIEICRTSTLGGHVEECDSSGNIRISYNSCRNRHCPKCQTLTRERWIEDRKIELLPVQYFHVVFTIPEELNALTLRNPKVMYDILFKAVSKTLIELGKDKEHIGAQLGFIALLHTWGQNLMHHPHIHCIVPGGGLSDGANKWISSKKKFLIHVKVLSAHFKRNFIKLLKKAYYNDELKFIGEVTNLGQKYIFQDWIGKLLSLKWVVYSKPTFKKPQHVIEYLGRYTHRVAISNHRIVSMDDSKVTFKWRDYKDNSKNKLMTVTAEEFIRRFLLHILPNKFVKIRHYGFLSNRNRKEKIGLCKKLIAIVINKKYIEPLTQYQKLNAYEFMLKIKGIDITVCPCCGSGKMITKSEILPKNGSPPIYYCN
jgi:hypothetical protein